MSQKILSNFILLTFTYSLLIFHAHAQGPEICSAYDPSIDKTPMNISINGAAQTLQQTACVQYFQINAPLLNNSFRYLTFEIDIQNYPSSEDFWPLLVEEVGSLPELYFTDDNTVQDKADSVDIMDYANKRASHRIIVDLSQISANSVIYFAMYQSFANLATFTPESFTYTVKATLSLLYPCPKNCSGNGECSQISKQCFCNPGFFDVDCSVPATFLNINQAASQVIEPNSWAYYYLNAQDYGSDLKLTIEKSSSPLYLAFLFNKGQTYSLPNLRIDQGQYAISSGVHKQALTLLESELNAYDGAVLMIGTYNSGTETVSVDIEFEIADGDGTIRTALMFTMIGISSALLAIWTIFTIVKYKVYIQAQSMLRTHLRLVNQKVHLSKEDIEKYFPQKGFDIMKSSFAQSVCSICLEDFKGDTMCRQLYCEHIYHDACIELWLSNRDSCPNCKKEMTVAAIEEFLAGPAKEEDKPEEQAAIVEEGRPLNDYGPSISQTGSLVLDGRQDGNGESESSEKAESKPELVQEDLKIESLERIEAEQERLDVVIELKNIKEHGV